MIFHLVGALNHLTNVIESHTGNSLYTSQIKSFNNPNPRDVEFYLKDPTKGDAKSDVKDEVAALKAQEEEMMAKLLGLPPPRPSASPSSTEIDRHDDRESKSRDKDRRHKHKHKHKHKDKKRDRSPTHTRRDSEDRDKPRSSSDAGRERRSSSPPRAKERKRARSPGSSPERAHDEVKRPKYAE